jgi:hypothetical protein
MSFLPLKETTMSRPVWYLSQILAWADDFHERTGRWPKLHDGRITGGLGATWLAVDSALRKGFRGLPGGSSLAQLLAEYRGVRNKRGLPSLTSEEILAWADAYHQHTGFWPTPQSGPIAGTPGETWAAVHAALFKGHRGFQGGSSLPQLLAEHRGVRNHMQLPPHTHQQILAWADAHHQRTGVWPNQVSGSIAGAPEETWRAVDAALRRGLRGLLGGSSLAQLLAKQRGVRPGKRLPEFTIPQILAWTDAHHQRTGWWPNYKSGPIVGGSGTTWLAVDRALRKGCRGFPGGSSLARLLAEQWGVRNPKDLPRLTLRNILTWADAHRQRTGAWPTAESGPVTAAPGETWTGVDTALKRGLRGLRGGSTLARLLTKHRGFRNPMALPPLTIAAILAWADAHRRRTGTWPTHTSGPIHEAPGETWSIVNAALRRGARGLSGGTSLHRLLVEEHVANVPP